MNRPLSSFNKTERLFIWMKRFNGNFVTFGSGATIMALIALNFLDLEKSWGYKLYIAIIIGFTLINFILWTISSLYVRSKIGKDVFVENETVFWYE